MVNPHQFMVDDVTFGIGDPHVTIETFDPGTVGSRNQDRLVPADDVLSFGIDYENPPLWTFMMSTDRESEAEAWESVERIEQIWRGDARKIAGQVVPMRYKFADRIRMVYGRPRNFAVAPDNRMLSGYIPISGQFQLAVAKYYDEDVQSQDFTLSTPPTIGGLTTPLITPLTTAVGVTPRLTTITVGGKIPTEVVLTIEGSGSNLRLEVVGQWAAQLVGSTDTDDVVTIDSRPWVRGVSIPGKLSRDTIIKKMLLPPGEHSVSFYSSSGGGAVATLSWQNAYRSM